MKKTRLSVGRWREIRTLKNCTYTFEIKFVIIFLLGIKKDFRGRGSMVERDLAKVETRVRFSSPAPFRRPPFSGGLFLRAILARGTQPQSLRNLQRRPFILLQINPSAART